MTAHPENPGAVGKACLKASTLLSRRARRVGNRSDERAMLAMAHVLDVLHRSGIGSSEPLPEEVLRTLIRLVEQLERDERGGTPASASSR